MNIKRYIAKDMNEAASKIRAQLGPDAVMLSSRPIRKKGLAGFFARPLVEVVVAYENEPTARGKKAQVDKVETISDAGMAQSEAPAAPTPAPIAPTPVERKIAEVERRLDTMTATVAEIATNLRSKPAPGHYDNAIQQLFLRLLDNEVEESVARAIADEAQDIRDRRKADPAEAFEQVVRQRLGEPEGIRLQRFQRTVVVFVGPTGAGKTTTIAKLAARYALQERMKVGLVTADAYRIAAHEQIQTYSDILEVPLKTIYREEDIVSALNDLQEADIVLIDTPGKSPRDTDHQGQIETLVRLSGATEVYLTVSAATGYRSARMVAEQYSFLPDYKLLLTKTDETITAGAFLNLRALCGRKLSYITTGQSVPDDIELVDVGQMVQTLLGVCP